MNEVFECVIASAAKQSMPVHEAEWIASSQGLLAMTGKQSVVRSHPASRVQRMQPMRYRRATPRRSCLCSTYPRKTAGLPVRHRGRAYIDDMTSELALPLLRPA